MLKPYQKAEISFREIEEIGHDGKNSQVFKVHDPQLDAEIVIKKIPKATFPDLSKYYEEAQTLYKTKHPNVVEIHYACEDSDYVYLAMPFYSCGSIKQLINTRFLSIREIIRYSIQVLSGLHNIHSKRLLHLDIKPDNILINASNEALVSDLGLARHVNYLGIAEQDRFYFKQIAPEAFSTTSVDIHFDIYQFGLSLYRMCNGNDCFNNQYKSFFDSTTEAFDREGFKFNVRNERFPDRDAYLLHIPRKMRLIINKCLKSNPDDRYSNCIELSNDLSKIDYSLDWAYERDDSCEKWISRREDRIIKLVKDASGYHAEKEMLATHRKQRITQYCQHDLSPSKLYTFFREV